MLVAAPGGFAHVRAPPPPVLANGCSPAQNSPRVLPASACVLWPTWRVPSSHLPGVVAMGPAPRGLATEPGLSVLSKGTAAHGMHWQGCAELLVPPASP